MTSKQCCSCKVSKPVSEFGKNKWRVDGLQHNCKACRAKLRQNTAAKNKDLIVDMTVVKKCSKCGVAKPLSEFHKSNMSPDGTRSECKMCRVAGNGRPQFATEGERIAYRKKYARRYARDHQDKINKYHRAWASKNKDVVAEYQQNRLNTLHGSLSHKMGVLINLSLKNGKQGRSWRDFVDYDLKDLERHLKRTMPNGYEWNDYLDGKLEIDHVIPRSAFNYTSPEDIDFARCWGLKNLQLLTKKENRKKWNRLDVPFQPSLAFGGTL